MRKKYSAFVIDGSMFFLEYLEWRIEIFIQMSIWYNYRFCSAFLDSFPFGKAIQSLWDSRWVCIDDDDWISKNGKSALYKHLKNKHKYFHSITKIYLFSSISAYFNAILTIFKFILPLVLWPFGLKFEDYQLVINKWIKNDLKFESCSNAKSNYSVWLLSSIASQKYKTFYLSFIHRNSKLFEKCIFEHWKHYFCQTLLQFAVRRGIKYRLICRLQISEICFSLITKK